MNELLRHDTAYELAKAILAIIQNCLREEEHRDAFDEFYEEIKQALIVHDAKRNKITPSSN